MALLPRSTCWSELCRSSLAFVGKWLSKYITIICIAALFATTAYADPDPVEERIRKRELIAQLESPHAVERMEAAYELQELWTTEELKKLLLGYTETWYVDNVKHERKIPPDLKVLTEALQAWPPAAEPLIDDMYKVEDKLYAPVIGDILALNNKFQGIDTGTAVASWVQESWYDQWRRRIPSGIIWYDLFKFVASKKWLLEKWLADEDSSEDSKFVVSRYAGLTNKYVTDALADEEWAQALDSMLTAGRYNLPAAFEDGYDQLGCTTYTELGWMTYADIVCILAGHPEWCENHQAILKEHIQMRLTWVNGAWVPMPRVIDQRNILMGIGLSVIKGDTQEAKDLLEQCFRKVIELEDSIKIQAILFLPMFQKLRDRNDFEGWWNEWNLGHPVVDDDPTFQKVSFE